MSVGTRALSSSNQFWTTINRVSPANGSSALLAPPSLTMRNRWPSGDRSKARQFQLPVSTYSGLSNKTSGADAFTLPFVSKAKGRPWARIAARVMIGAELEALGEAAGAWSTEAGE